MLTKELYEISKIWQKNVKVPQRGIFTKERLLKVPTQLQITRTGHMILVVKLNLLSLLVCSN